ncbi:PD-(D/E)XK nuclease family protein [Paenibacillus sp. BIC5C1]|uniref:PD-(D/E)XK nuclease family protein n=1 Tax=Paenibacillus sp. BIC5C1 TaxID=3078263 RepID=UPI0028EB0A0B|nr:PD-(D/E)XK nuclease family protein [Paenibacillus sp. BIC5C1]
MAQYPQWSYSQSRASMFDECLRKYYYHYYGAHNGWKAESADEMQVRLYRLKQLSNLYLVFGDLAHRMCESAVRSREEGKDKPREHFLEQTMRKLLNQAYVESMDQDQWRLDPKNRVMLSEMYYGDDTLSDRIATIKERASACVGNLYQTLTWEDLSRASTDILEIEKWDTMMLHDTRVYVKMDLLYRRSNGNIVIVDWKTGKEDDFSDQLMLYASYVREHYRVPLEQIELRVEYLLTGTHREFTATEEDILKVEENVGRYIAEMRSCVDDEYYNRPKDVSYFTPMPSRRACRDCNFREVCSERVV